MELEFAEVEQTLKQHDLNIDAAYFHGMLSGLLCAGIRDDDVDDWLPALFSDRFITEADYKRLSDNVLSVFYAVRAELDQDGFGFRILLPDDACALDYRVFMMGSWCRGYLIALIDYGETAVESLSVDCAEFVSDVEQIGEVEIDEDETDDNLDESFVLLEEHLRVGVQLVYEHLNPLQSS